MKRMCPAEEQDAAAEPPEEGNGQLASGGASGIVEWAYLSDPGSGRDSNEDYAGAIVPEDTDTVPLFVVADGMGGHAAGEVASRLAVETVLTTWQSSGSGPAHQRLRSAVSHTQESQSVSTTTNRAPGLRTRCASLSAASIART